MELLPTTSSHLNISDLRAKKSRLNNVFRRNSKISLKNKTLREANQEKEVSEGYISAIQAAQMSGYSADHISRLCRSGSLLGQKIKGNWFVQEKSFDNIFKKYLDKKDLRNMDLSAQMLVNYRVEEIERSKKEKNIKDLDHIAQISVYLKKNIAIFLVAWPQFFNKADRDR